ncbi:hypothetical protein SK128_019919, partial [Halocaridina rubra]
MEPLSAWKDVPMTYSEIRYESWNDFGTSRKDSLLLVGTIPSLISFPTLSIQDSL